MVRNHKQLIFVVDDEPEVCGVLGRTLQLAGYDVACFDSARECLLRMRTVPFDLLITDIVMPGMDGIELLIEVKRTIPSLPVLMITGYGDVEKAVRAMDAGAWNLIQKPLERSTFLAAVEKALACNHAVRRRIRKPLTRTEVEVLGLILEGKGNKEIARLRHRSVRTIEDQRRGIMHKFGVDNTVDLIKEVAIVRMPGRLDSEQLTFPFIDR